MEIEEDRYGILKRLVAELDDVPVDERQFAALAWATGAAAKGYKTIEEILGDCSLKARLLDDFDDEEADDRVSRATGSATTIPPVFRGRSASRKIGRNEACPCGSGKKYKKCCQQ